MNIYIDSNIFIYVALRHPQFGEPCRRFLSKVQQGMMSAVTSAITLCEVHYEVTKHLGKEAAELVIQSISSLPIEILSVDINIIYSALHQIREL